MWWGRNYHTTFAEFQASLAKLKTEKRLPPWRLPLSASTLVSLISRGAQEPGYERKAEVSKGDERSR
eukprot:SAG11_NODE_406_length_9736_cov_3.229117_2_plen_67_part_00